MCIRHMETPCGEKLSCFLTAEILHYFPLSFLVWDSNMLKPLAPEVHHFCSSSSLSLCLQEKASPEVLSLSGKISVSGANKCKITLDNSEEDR